MEFVKIGLLVISVLGAIKPPRGFSNWIVPALAASAGLYSNLVKFSDLKTSTVDMAPAILFLLAVVPMAVLLDYIGFFKAAATFALNRKKLFLWLWILAAVTTALINLDASVVLLTPLYITLARQEQIDPKLVVVIPVLLASLASGFLPISNLTNLILVDRFSVGSGYFLAKMGLPVIFASTLGYFLYCRAVRGLYFHQKKTRTLDIKPLVIGSLIVVLLVLGFLIGPYFSVKEWEVALVADIALAIIAKSVPIKAIPLKTALLVLCLGPLTLAAISHFHFAHYFVKDDFLSLLLIGVVSLFGANLFNNLPTTLVAVAVLKSPLPEGTWPFLLGVDMGPSILITGSLAAILWLELTKTFGVKFQPIEYAKWGMKVTLPSFAASLIVLVFELLILR